MTAYDPQRCAELCREAREDDAAMLGGKWTIVGSGYIVEVESSLLHPDGINIGVGDDLRRPDALGIARTRNNLAAMADQLEAASARLDDATDALHQRRDEVAKLTAERDALAARVRELEGEAIRLRATADRFATSYALLAKIRADGTWISPVNPERQTIERHIDKVLGMVGATAPTAGKEGE